MTGGGQRAWLVARREWTQRIRSRAFRVSTVLSILIVVAIIVVPQIVGNAGKPTRTVAIVGSHSAVLPASLRLAGDQSDIIVRVVTFPTEAAARGALRSGDVAVVLVDQRALLWKAAADAKLRTVVASAVQAVDRREAIAELGLTPEQAQRLLRPPSLTSTSLEPQTKERSDRVVLATVGLILLFVAISTYGGVLLVGVVEEKSSRVVEVLLSRLRPTELLMGKIAGIGLVGLAQFGAVALVAILVLSFSGSTHVPPAAPAAIAWIVVWFVLGYAFYSVMYGAAGSLASRQEDAQAMTFPISAVLLVGYLLSFTVLQDPNSAVAVIGSLVPFTAPMVMTVRMGTGGVPWWQITLSMALMVATIVVMVRLAGRVYAGAVLRIGGRVRLREAWGGARI
jgi:ABC-2 type transport system permease protein